MSNAVKKLEKIFKESPEAREALREWLNDLEREIEREKQPSPTSVIHAPSVTIAQPSKRLLYGSKRARFYADPEDYGWGLIKIVEDCRQALYEREYKFGTVKLIYSYTTGTVQLVYPKWKHPEYAEEELARIDREREENDLSDDDDDVYIPNIVENFRDLTEAKFKNMLRNVHTYFGKGYV
jgi:hypothetical protein